MVGTHAHGASLSLRMTVLVPLEKLWMVGTHAHGASLSLRMTVLVPLEKKSRLHRWTDIEGCPLSGAIYEPRKEITFASLDRPFTQTGSRHCRYKMTMRGMTSGHPSLCFKLYALSVWGGCFNRRKATSAML